MNINRFLSHARSFAIVSGILAIFCFMLHILFEPSNAGLVTQLVTHGFHPKFGFHTQAIFLSCFRVLRWLFAFFLFVYLLRDDALKEAGYIYLIRQTLSIFLLAFSSTDQSSIVYLLLLSIVLILSVLSLVFFILGFLRHQVNPLFIYIAGTCLVLLILVLISSLFGGTRFNVYSDFIQRTISISFLGVLLVFLYTDSAHKKKSPNSSQE